MDLKEIGGEEVDWIHLQRQMEGCCANGYEISGFAKCGEFLGHLKNFPPPPRNNALCGVSQ